MRKIVTSHIYPPIPDRSHDWCAHYEGEEEAGNYGWGRTEAEAVQDLLDNNEMPPAERSVARTDAGKSDGDRNPVDAALVTAGRDRHFYTAADAINDIRADLAEIARQDAKRAVQAVSMIMAPFARRK